ncbi:YkvA family protein [Niallia nealsonii]|uniref:Methyltransferase type 11 n=1 Tax=Niallia nealsonii TaxID=115979 RepID=A0A2N0Z137_9BACI|nr:YkvA family protein [Niallia nealsonii]PKG23230.1 methyltransferase type 11 [Niallia nealsonii]
MLFKKRTIKNGYKKHQKEAEKLVDNPKRLESLLKKIIPKTASNKKGLAEIWDDFLLLISLTKSWYKGEYRQISKKSMVMVIAGFLYFFSPIDLIPDFIFGLGILDDAIVLKFLISNLTKELEHYKQWQKIHDSASDSSL